MNKKEIQITTDVWEKYLSQFFPDDEKYVSLLAQVYYTQTNLVEAKLDLQQKKSNLARAIGHLYNQQEIKGGNAEQRKALESLLTYDLQMEVDKAEAAVQQIEIDVQLIEMAEKFYRQNKFSYFPDIINQLGKSFAKGFLEHDIEAVQHMQKDAPDNEVSQER